VSSINIPDQVSLYPVYNIETRLQVSQKYQHLHHLPQEVPELSWLLQELEPR